MQRELCRYGELRIFFFSSSIKRFIVVYSDGEAGLVFAVGREILPSVFIARMYHIA